VAQGDEATAVPSEEAAEVFGEAAVAVAREAATAVVVRRLGMRDVGEKG
jgi:hypothetical protein